MKKLELEKMIKEKELELEKLKKELELEKLKKELENTHKAGLIFEPKLNEFYYCINPYGEVYGCQNENDSLDKSTFNHHLVYPTEELAEKARDRQQAKNRVIKEIARLNDGWIPGWEDSQEYKYFVYYSYFFKQLDSHAAIIYKELDNNLYLKSKELAKQLIETHREDLLLMLEVK